MLVILFIRRGKVKKTSVTVMFFMALFVYKFYLFLLLPAGAWGFVALACMCLSFSAAHRRKFGLNFCIQEFFSNFAIVCLALRYPV